MWTEATWVEDGKMWYYGMNDGCIYCWDIQNGAATYIDSVVEYGTDCFRQYSGIVKLGDTLFLLPDLAKELLVYHLGRKEIHRYELPRKGERFVTRNCFVENQLLYFVSTHEKAVYEIDTCNPSEIKIYSAVINDSQEIGEESIKKGNKLYIPCQNQNTVLVFDILTKELKEYEIGRMEGGFYTICSMDDEFWLTGTCNKIIKWSEEKNEILQVLDIPEEVEQYWLDQDQEQLVKEKYPCSIADGVAPFYKSYCSKNYIWFIPFYSEQIVYIDKRTNEIRILEIEGENEDYDSQMLTNRPLLHKYILEYADGDKIVLFSCKTRNKYELDCERATYKKTEFIIDWELVLTHWLDHMDVIREDETINLKKYISAVLLSEKKSKK